MGEPGEPGEQGDPGAPAPLDPDLTPLEKLIAGAGGEAAIAALTTVQLEAVGSRAVIDEGYRPTDPSVVVSTFSATSAVDLTNDLWRFDYSKTNFIFGVQLRSTEYVRGNLGYVDGIEHAFGFPTGDMLSDRWASTVKTQALLNPVFSLIRSAADGSEEFVDAGTVLIDGSVHHVLRVDDDAAPLFVYVNARTGVVSSIETLENDHVRGDVSLAAYYLGWRTVGDVRMPTEVFLALDGEVIHSERRIAMTTNAAIPAATFEFPAAAAPAFDATAAARGFRNSQFHQMFAHAIGIPTDGIQNAIVAAQLAPDVFHLMGGSHHSIAVNQANGVVIIEAPLYEARSEAIIAWAEAQFPGKPITHVLNTHHHADHAGGLRAFAAVGATVVVGEATAAFFEEQLGESRTVLPDRLTLNPVPFALEVVPAGGSFRIDDPVHPVVSYHINSGHAADMQTIFLPSDGVVFNSDLYNPGFPLQGPASLGSALEYAAALEELGLAVSTVAGGHGGPAVTYAEFRAAVGL